jgi:hypothetical protein
MLLPPDLLYATPPANADPPMTAASNKTRLDDHDDVDGIDDAVA